MSDDPHNPAPLADVMTRLVAKVQSRTPIAPAPESTHVSRLARAEERGVPHHARIRDVIRTGGTITPALKVAREATARFSLARSDHDATRGTLPALLVLLGPSRAGKTVALCDAVAGATIPALYTTTYRMADVPRPRFADDEAHPFVRWRTVDILAIDELHADATVVPRIRSLLYERWDEGRCTILAGNITEAQFIDCYLSDAALHRRVLEEYPPGCATPWLVTVDSLEPL